MEKLTEEQKKQALSDFEKKQAKQYHIGKIIVFTLSTINIITALASAFIHFDIITLVVQITLSILLYNGIAWVRYFFAVGYIISAVFLLGALAKNNVIQNAAPFIIVIAILEFVFCLVSSLILIKSKCVSEFLYSQENG